MATPEFLDIDPRALHLPSSRLSGADPVKLHDQMARFGSGMAGMPPVLAYRGSDAAIMIYDGVTRATRVASLLPGQRSGRSDEDHRQARRPSALTRGYSAMTSRELKQEILRSLAELVEHYPGCPIRSAHRQPVRHRTGTDPRGGLGHGGRRVIGGREKPHRGLRTSPCRSRLTWTPQRTRPPRIIGRSARSSATLGASGGGTDPVSEDGLSAREKESGS